jgi:hypothetical protein
MITNLLHIVGYLVLLSMIGGILIFWGIVIRFIIVNCKHKQRK